MFMESRCPITKENKNFCNYLSPQSFLQIYLRLCTKRMIVLLLGSKYAAIVLRLQYSNRPVLSFKPMYFDLRRMLCSREPLAGVCSEVGSSAICEELCGVGGLLCCESRPLY